MNTKQNPNRLAMLSIVCLLLAGTGGCKSLAYYIGANTQSASLDHKRDWATRSHVAAYNQAPYYHCCHCGEVVAWGTKHACAPVVAPQFFGHQGTCWRPWPTGWVNCPEQLIDEQVEPMMSESSTMPELPSVPTVNLESRPLPVYSDPVQTPTFQGPVAQKSKVFVPGKTSETIVLKTETSESLEPMPQALAKTPTPAAGLPLIATPESLQSVLHNEPSARLASRKPVTLGSAAPEPAAAPSVESKIELSIPENAGASNAASSHDASSADKGSDNKGSGDKEGSVDETSQNFIPKPKSPIAGKTIVAKKQTAKPVVAKQEVVSQKVVSQKVVSQKVVSQKVVKREIIAKKQTVKPVLAKKSLVAAQPIAKPVAPKPFVAKLTVATASKATSDKSQQGAADIRFRTVSAVRFSENGTKASVDGSPVRTARFDAPTKARKNVQSPAPVRKAKTPNRSATNRSKPLTPKAKGRSRLQGVRIHLLDS